MSQIFAYFLSLHATLGNQSDAPDIDEFLKQHLKIWTKCDEQLHKRLVKLQDPDPLSPDEIIELSKLLVYLNM